ncbi:MAG: glycosyltransferase family 2 protein [Lactobacillus crispatus]
MNPLVSIVVPVYNVEKYLKKCIESLIDQTYQNIEILLVDDGSTDSSGKICDDYAKKYSFVYSFHKANSGLGFTRNYGLERINGEYVTFVDSDDYLGKDAIKRLVAGLDGKSIDTVIGGYSKVKDNGDVLYTREYTESIFRNENVYKKLFISMLGSSPNKHDSIRPSVWNVIYSKKIIEENKLHFVSERELISEDIVWDSDYYKYAKSAKIINSTEYYYRSNPTSLTKKYQPDRFEKSIYFFMYMVDKLSKLNLANKSFTEARLRLAKTLFINVRSSLSQLEFMPIRKIIKNVREICSNADLNEVIKNYPIDKLAIRQRLFVLLIKHKFILILSILIKVQVI